MPIFPEELKAVEGRAIPPAWVGLGDWVDEFPVPKAPPDVRVRELPGETIFFKPPRSPAWIHPFRVFISGTEATVRPGLLNLEMPRMGTENLTLNGLDESGDDAGRVPVLELLGQRYGGSGPDRRSFICLRVVVDLESGEPEKDASPLGFLTVVHRPDLPEGFHSGGMPEILEDDKTIGLWPLAVLYWNEDGDLISQVIQNCIHNQQHRYARGVAIDGSESELKPGRHWFFGAD
ncbi:MAG: hypothetical protein QM496_13965 [Verrucomicrobiota bacterium]